MCQEGQVIRLHAHLAGVACAAEVETERKTVTKRADVMTARHSKQRLVMIACFDSLSKPRVMLSQAKDRDYGVDVPLVTSRTAHDILHLTTKVRDTGIPALVVSLSLSVMHFVEPEKAILHRMESVGIELPCVTGRSENGAKTITTAAAVSILHRRRQE